MIVSGFLGVLAGSLLWLDRVFVFQLMISRPLIMGPIIALVMGGDVKIGILIGASLELLWLNAPPVGSYLPDDESFCTAVAVPVGIFAGSTMDHTAAAGLSILLSLPLSIVGKSLDMHCRTLNERLIPSTECVQEKDVSLAIKKAIGRTFVLTFIVLTASTALLWSIVYLLKTALPGVMLTSLTYMPFVCVIIGLAALVSKDMPKKLHAGVFILGITLVLLITWIL
jgi:mannose/fructose/N-acetylgalactosamine-specific phosphotransferase system component IIC